MEVCVQLVLQSFDDVDNLEALYISVSNVIQLCRVKIITFRCMNFCSGSYHSSRTSPEGTAAHKNVLSVYGLRAKEEKSRSAFEIHDLSSSSFRFFPSQPITGGQRIQASVFNEQILIQSV